MNCDELYEIDSIQSKLKADESRSCLFTDYSLCYNFIHRKWIYYTEIDAFTYDINGQLKKLQLPFTLKHVIYLRFASSAPMFQEENRPQDQFTFTIMHSNNSNFRNKNNIFFSDEWTIYGETTSHQLVVAHDLYEGWYKIYKAMDNFLYNGIINSNISINVIMRKQKPRHPIPSKFRNGFEPLLFNEVFYGLDELYSKYSNYSKICFKNIVIGTNEYSGLSNGLHTNNQLLKYMRKKILQPFNLSDLYKPNMINILYLKKSQSTWGNNNFISNINNNEIINATKQRYNDLNYVNVLSMDPTIMGIKEQINILHKCLIIISPIGGIGYMNFLQPLDGVQIYLNKWGIHPDFQYFWNINETFIPENDHYMHYTQTLQTVLKYVDLSDKYNYTKGDLTWPWSVKEQNLFSVIDKAIKIIKQRFIFNAL
eukprot:244914_1